MLASSCLSILFLSSLLYHWSFSLLSSVCSGGHASLATSQEYIFSLTLLFFYCVFPCMNAKRGLVSILQWSILEPQDRNPEFRYGAKERNFMIGSDQILPKFTELVIAPVAGIKGGVVSVWSSTQEVSDKSQEQPVPKRKLKSYNANGWATVHRVWRFGHDWSNLALQHKVNAFLNNYNFFYY